MEVSRILVFLVPPQVLTIFSLKTLPEPEEVPKKPKSGGENLATKKIKVAEVLGLEVSRILVFLVPPQVLPKTSATLIFLFFFAYLLRFWQGFS